MKKSNKFKYNIKENLKRNGVVKNPCNKCGKEMVWVIDEWICKCMEK